MTPLTPALGGSRGVEPVSRDQLERNLRLLRIAATRDDRLVLLGQIGEALCQLGRYREAEATLREAVTLAADLADRRSRVVNLLRLGDAIRHLNRHDEAEPLLREAREAAAAAGGAMTDLHARTLHEHGSCLVEMGRRDDGVEALLGALEIRRATGDRAVLAATERALDALGVAR